MIATLLLLVRLAISFVLYIFIGWVFYLMLQDLRAQERQVATKKTPPVVLAVDEPAVDEPAVYQPGVHQPAGEEIQQFVHSPITIGRDPACDFVLAESTVSTRHAILSYHHNQWWIEDLNSTNGTLLNGQPVLEPVVLTTNDQVKCGQVDLHVIISTGETKTQPIVKRTT